MLRSIRLKRSKSALKSNQGFVGLLGSRAAHLSLGQVQFLFAQGGAKFFICRLAEAV